MTTYTIKISLGEDIRRFSFQEKPSFDQLKEVLQKLYVDVTLDNYIIKYQDEEQDLITVSCDLELNEAFTITNSKVLRMSLVPKKRCLRNKMPIRVHEETVHNFIICDGCEKTPIVGVRWKCSDCPDYDLCSECETKGVHKETGHRFVKIENSREQFFGHGPRGFGLGRCGRRGFGEGCPRGFGSGCRRGLGEGFPRGFANGFRRGFGCGGRGFGHGCPEKNPNFCSKENVEVVPVKSPQPVIEKTEEVVPVNSPQPVIEKTEEVVSVIEKTEVVDAPKPSEIQVDNALLSTLKDMGFSNEELLKTLLAKFKNNLVATLDELTK